MTWSYDAFPGRTFKKTSRGNSPRGSKTEGNRMPFDVVLVADRARISLAVALNIVISRKTCPEARFTVAVPEDSGFDHPLAEEVIKEFAHDIISIPAPCIQIDGKSYRLEN